MCWLSYGVSFPVLFHRDPIGAVNVFHPTDVDMTPELRRVGEAFATMAYRQEVDMEAAFRYLVGVAAKEGKSVTEVASRTVAEARQLP